MALNGNFISFETVMESVYRRTGYQKLDLNDIVEVISETMRLIGVLPAFTDITTNGLNGNVTPLEVSDFRVVLPTDLLELKAIRKVNLVEEEDEEGNTINRINSFSEMIEASDLFYQSTFEQNNTVPTGIYNYTSLATQYTVTLLGSSGSLTISETGNLTKTITFASDLTTTANNFVTANAATYAVIGITLTSDDSDLIFTETNGGSGGFSKPVITNISGDLNAVVARDDIQAGPIIVESPVYSLKTEHVYTYKINNRYIYTNFETGFIELTYTGFVTDNSGFPMIPDDERYIKAIEWSIIEFLDYKKWRNGDLPDKVYQNTAQKRSFYIASAISKASLPTIDQMESIKNMWLRSIPKVNEHSTYWKYFNIGERRYNHNR